MANEDSFVHLHVHTEYSMLDGAAKIKPLVAEAAKMGMPAIAITDHGNNFGSYEFYKAAKAAGVKPIIGTEAYITPGTARGDRTRVRWGDDNGSDDVSGGGAYTHMTLLAESTEGMHNLFRLSSLASIEGYFYKPRMDRELLSTYSKGIIATTGCVGGEVQTKLRLGLYQEAVEAAAEFRDIFGPDNFFAEIMDHGIGIERRTMNDLIKLAKDLKIPLLATNDLHYTHAHDADAHAALLCVQSASTLADPNRFKFDGNEFYLKSPAEMRAIFKDHPDACDNTLLIAERCEVEFTERNLMPRFPVPEGHTEDSWFEAEVMAGMQRRFNGNVPEVQAKQATYEVEVIKKMGFPGYFLVVADFIAWARAQGIRVGPGRGSAAGSIVAYAMGITELDPVHHGLIFERFLNPERISMPDIDVDFDDRRRGEVIKYVTQKYGSDRVAQIVTYGTIKAKQSLKDAARVLAMPYSVGERLTKAMPPMVLGKDVSLSEIMVKPESKEAEEKSRYKEGQEFRDIVASDDDSAKTLELAMGLEGLKRQWGVHAAGVIMSAEPLLDVLPIMKREDDGAIITQFDQPPCEALGLLKMDFLGLRNLTVLEDAIENIKTNRNKVVVLEDLDLDADKPTYDLLSRGDTLGVFQLDGENMRSLLRILKPTEFEHISAVIALYRPGPMGMNSHINYAQRKNGVQQIEAIHPELEKPLADILGPTYGLIVYQEQVMAVAQRVAGFTLGQADLLRRAMGKKKKEELDKQYEGFSAGMKANGYSDGAIKVIWDTLLPFADYAFNKAHSAGYGVLSYWTAYLKANYPAEYMAALLTSVRDSKDKLGLYLNECRRQGIQVLSPDVNASYTAFTAVGEDIRFGLGAVRNVGANVVEGIVEARQTKGAFTSFGDFLKKVPPVVCNKRTIEALIKAGAFDSLGHSRRALFEVFEEAIDAETAVKKNEALGQVDLFGDFLGGDDAGVQVPDLAEWTKRDKLAFEREMLGLYVSDHPLAGHEKLLTRYQDKTVADIHPAGINEEGVEEIGGLRDGDVISVAGLITSVQNRVARASGNPWAAVVLEDFTGELQVTFMGKVYAEFGPMLKTDQVVAIKGRLRERDEAFSLSAMSMQIVDVGAEDSGSTAPVHLRIPAIQATRELLTELDRIINQYPGTTEVYVTLTGQAEEQLFLLPAGVKVTSELYGELKVLLGRAAVGAPREDVRVADTEEIDLPNDLDAPPLHADELPEPPEDLG
jgi:DNA polymerase-3 subunit alpha